MVDVSDAILHHDSPIHVNFIELWLLSLENYQLDSDTHSARRKIIIFPFTHTRTHTHARACCLEIGTPYISSANRCLRLAPSPPLRISVWLWTPPHSNLGACVLNCYATHCGMFSTWREWNNKHRRFHTLEHTSMQPAYWSEALQLVVI
jgi:hypothetical protein